MRPVLRRSTRAVALAAACGVLLAACAGGGASEDGTDPTTATSSGQQQLTVQVASYDMAVGEDQRLIVGLLTPDNALVDYGEVPLQLVYLGTQDDRLATPEPGPTATATWIPVPGTDVPADPPDAPEAVDAGQGPGVYQASVDLDRAGLWGVVAEVDLGDGPLQGQGITIVRDHHLVPTVGDPAPDVANLTMADIGDVPAAAVDSRAGTNETGEVPDPQLHDSTIAEDLAAGRPFLVVLSTPVYCVSRFCGPVTETMAELEEQYGDRVDVIHVEVWRDYDEATLNDAFDTWVNEGGNGHEPWTFLVDGDGTIVQRWDNVPDLDRLTAGLDELAA